MTTLTAPNPTSAAATRVDKPCGVKGCGHAADWYGDQHGCRQGFRCDHHKQRIVEGLDLGLTVRGYLQCGICRQRFLAINDYVAIRPVAN